jgi:crossover junction endodeoxyribonuclease RusA
VADLKISVETGWPMPKLWPNSRAHRMQVWRAQQAATREAFWATNIVKPRDWKPDGSRFKLTIRAHPSVARNRDDDGMIGACKAYRDGIAHALKVDDSLFDLQPVRWGDMHSRGRVIFDVESVP